MYKVYKKYIVRDLLFKKNRYNLDKLIDLDNITITMELFGLNNVESGKVINSIKFLEKLIGGRVYVKERITNVYENDGTIFLKVVLRDRYLYNFLLYISVILNPLFIKKNGLVGYSLFENGLNIYRLSDKTVFFENEVDKGITEDVCVNLFVKNNSIEDLLYILQSIGIDVGNIKKNNSVKG